MPIAGPLTCLYNVWEGETAGPLELAEWLPASCLRSIVAGGDLSGHWMVLSGAGTNGPDTLQA